MQGAVGFIVWAAFAASHSAPALSQVPAQNDSSLELPFASIQVNNPVLASPKLTPLKFAPDSKPYTLTDHIVCWSKGDANDPARPIFNLYFNGNPARSKFAESVAKELCWLWNYDRTNLHFDHSLEYNEGAVDVYLCDQGQPGGQQLFGTDNVGGTIIKTDEIYIYNIDTLTDPLESAREVAHEYGHAVLPTFGGYKEPEYWANGLLGEKLFLTTLLHELKAGNVTSDFLMGATEKDLQPWVDAKVAPLVFNASHRRPNTALFTQTDAAGMNALLGQILFCHACLPLNVFARSLRLLTGTKPQDYAAAAVLAVEEQGFTFQFPESVRGQKVWVPVGTSRLTGSPILGRTDGWDEIVAGSQVTLASTHS